MSSMLVCYGEKSDESKLNKSFGLTILSLLEIEGFRTRQLKIWCADKGIELPEDVWDCCVDSLQQLSLIKFIICLHFSNNQLETHREDIFKQKQLLWADIGIESLKFDDLYNLDGDLEHNFGDPLSKYALELYTTNLFLRCSMMYHIKDFVQHCCATKTKMESLENRIETFPELFAKGVESVVKIPWKFPTPFLKKVTKEQTLDSKISICFSKVMLKDASKLYRNVDPEDVGLGYVKVDLKWLESSNAYVLSKLEDETSQTSLALEEIKQRQIERQRIFEDDLEFMTPKADLEVFRLFQKDEIEVDDTDTHTELKDKAEKPETYIEETTLGEPLIVGREVVAENSDVLEMESCVPQTIQTNQQTNPKRELQLKQQQHQQQQVKSDPIKPVFEPPLSHIKVEHDFQKENFAMNSVETDTLHVNSEFHEKIVTGMDHVSPLRTSNNDVMDMVPIDFAMVSSFNHLMFVPKLDDVNEADCIIKIEVRKSASLSSPQEYIPFSQRLSRLCWFLKKNKTEKSTDTFMLNKGQFSNFQDMTLPPLESKVTFRKFLRAKIRQIKEDILYYKNVAIYCMDDIKNYIPEEQEYTA